MKAELKHFYAHSIMGEASRSGGGEITYVVNAGPDGGEATTFRGRRKEAFELARRRCRERGVPLFDESEEASSSGAKPLPTYSSEGGPMYAPGASGPGGWNVHVEKGGTFYFGDKVLSPHPSPRSQPPAGARQIAPLCPPQPAFCPPLRPPHPPSHPAPPPALAPRRSPTGTRPRRAPTPSAASPRFRAASLARSRSLRVAPFAAAGREAGGHRDREAHAAAHPDDAGEHHRTPAAPAPFAPFFTSAPRPPSRRKSISASSSARRRPRTPASSLRTSSSSRRSTARRRPSRRRPPIPSFPPRASLNPSTRPPPSRERSSSSSTPTC